MIAYYRAVRPVSRIIAAATNRTVAALREGRIEQEPAMTDRMLGSIEEAINGRSIRGIRWYAKTLKDRGPAAQEKTFGADFIGVLNITLPEFSVSKGFLAQAKLVRGGKIDDVKRLRHQCELMLTYSPDSFVFLYSETEIRVLPAISIVSANVDSLPLYRRSVQRFFEEHLQCFVGDRAINAANPAVLENLRRQVQARKALLLEGRSEQLPLVPLN